MKLKSKYCQLVMKLNKIQLFLYILFANHLELAAHRTIFGRYEK